MPVRFVPREPRSDEQSAQLAVAPLKATASEQRDSKTADVTETADVSKKDEQSPDIDSTSTTSDSNSSEAAVD